MRPKKEHVFGLDVIRTLVVFFVVLHHLSPLCLSGWMASLATLGSLGVEILFVLSGFLLGQTLFRAVQENRLSTGTEVFGLLAKRWRRIVPAYYFFFFITAAAFPPFLGQVASHLQYLFFLQNFAWQMPPFYFQTWALGVLEFFYVLFTLSFFFCRKIFARTLTSFSICISLFFLIPLILRALWVPLLGSDDFLATVRLWVVYRLDGPVVGIILAVVLREFPQAWNWLLRHSWMGLSLFAGTVVYYLLGLPWLFTNHWLEILFYPLVNGILALSMPFLWAWKENLSRLGRMVSWVGKASYSIYISHVVAIVLGFYLMELILKTDRLPGFIIFLVCVPLILLIAWLSYLYVESPFISHRNGAFQKSGDVFATYGVIRQKARSWLPSRRALESPSKSAELTNE